MGRDGPGGQPTFYDDLDLTLREAWQLMCRGVADRRSACHTPTLATLGLDGAPRLRTVVLRGAEPAERSLRIHTDHRSAKVAEIAAETRVGLHFYDPGAKIQLRIAATAVVHGESRLADGAWARTPAMARRCYLAQPAPGTPSDAPLSGLTAEHESALPRGAESEAGRENFAVLRLTVESIEWLYIAARGHRRARFDWRADGRMAATWLVP